MHKNIHLGVDVLKITNTNIEEIKNLKELKNYLILDLSLINELQSVLWFRKLRSHLVSYNKILIGACNPAIHLENLKAASISIIEVNDFLNNNNQNIAPEESKTDNTSNATNATVPIVTQSSIIHHGNLRSGQTLNNPDGDLILVGNLHPGSEIIAGGHIHILGSLAGRALAGTKIGKDAIISCFSLSAELISIDGYYLSSDEIKTVNHATIISLLDDHIHIK